MGEAESHRDGAHAAQGGAHGTTDSAHPTGHKKDHKNQPPKTAGQKLRSGLLEITFIVVGALIISAILRAFVGQMFIIPSGSMENTLMPPNDRVVVSKVSDYHRGSIVVFVDPGGWLSETTESRHGAGKILETLGLLPSTAENHLIKRIIGLPGDHVKCCDVQGRITVNGVALDEKSYLYSDASGTVAPSNFEFDVTVPAGRIFVMGDHRNASGDSRCHLSDLTTDGKPNGMNAFVPESDVVGPAVAIAAPLNRMRSLPIPATFKNIPAPTAPAPADPKISVTNPDC